MARLPVAWIRYVEIAGVNSPNLTVPQLWAKEKPGPCLGQLSLSKTSAEIDSRYARRGSLFQGGLLIWDKRQHLVLPFQTRTQPV